MTQTILFGLLGLCAAAFWAWPMRGKGLRGWGVPLCFGLFFAGLLIHQACWQLSGFGSVDFLKFQRRYDVRAVENGVGGMLLDRDGKPLAVPQEGRRTAYTMPLGAAGLHVVGYSGRTGALRVYEARLLGFTVAEHPSDLLRRAVPEDIRLTIDARLQRRAYELLDGRKGAVVALDPRSGEILALVSSPSVDPAQVTAAANDTTNAPLFNRATQGLYPPGSVFKAFSAALTLQQGEDRSRTCPAEGWVASRGTPRIRDTHRHPKGEDVLDLETAFAESSNIWFAQSVRDCGWPAFHAMTHKHGLDAPLTLAACGDRSYVTAQGIVPDLSKRPNQLAYVGFGQGTLLLTPMHVAALTAAIANDGVLMPPHLELGAPVTGQRVWESAIARRVRELMTLSVEKGTSRNVSIWGLDVAGKTGTAETSGRDHAWFTCFAPADDPQIVITVLVENAGFGAQVALPIARSLLKTWDSNR